jgi:hypothetical protein
LLRLTHAMPMYMTLGLFELTAIAVARPLALIESWSTGLGPIGAKPYRLGSLFRTPPARNGLLRRLRLGSRGADLRIHGRPDDGAG